MVTWQGDVKAQVVLKECENAATGGTRNTHHVEALIEQATNKPDSERA